MSQRNSCTLNYTDARPNIQTGDILIWKKDRLSFLSNLFLKIVRIFTLSEFAHVAVAWRVGPRLFAIEATQPFVRIFPVSEYDDFYHIPLKIQDVKEESLNFLLNQVGCRYSFKDAIKAYFKMPISYNSGVWECASLAGEFLRKEGLDITAVTPSDLVDELLVKGYSIYLVRSN